MSSNAYLTESRRTQLILEIENTLITTKDLRPFISAWAVIEARFRGIAEIEEELDPVVQIYSFIERERESTNLITEELFVAWLLQLPVLSKNVVCKSSGNVWEPILESYMDFKDRTNELLVSDLLSNSEKVNEFYRWMVQLCNWDGGCMTNQSSNIH